MAKRAENLNPKGRKARDAGRTWEGLRQYTYMLVYSRKYSEFYRKEKLNYFLEDSRDCVITWYQLV